jgi:hypothetical protein
MMQVRNIDIAAIEAARRAEAAWTSVPAGCHAPEAEGQRRRKQLAEYRRRSDQVPQKVR